MADFNAVARNINTRWCFQSFVFRFVVMLQPPSFDVMCFLCIWFRFLADFTVELWAFISFYDRKNRHKRGIISHSAAQNSPHRKIYLNKKKTLIGHCAVRRTVHDVQVHVACMPYVKFFILPWIIIRFFHAWKPKIPLELAASGQRKRTVYILLHAESDTEQWADLMLDLC